jgi:hypothetical protein
MTMLQKLIIAGAIVALLTSAAFAQMPMPGLSLGGTKQRTPEEQQRDEAIDKAYRSATKKIPDQKTVNDPWAEVRTPPPATSQNKKQQ